MHFLESTRYYVTCDSVFVDRDEYASGNTHDPHHKSLVMIKGVTTKSLFNYSIRVIVGKENNCF